MAILITLHLGLANTATLFTLALSVWGFYRFFSGQGVDGSYLGAVVIGEGLIIVQALIGLLLFSNGLPLARTSLHILYGICAVISFPGLYAYTQGLQSRREMLLWALITFFVFGLTIRLANMV